jgi:hypothetical protein
MATEIDDITMQYEEDGVVLVKELDKVVLSRGAWATIIFRYQQWERGKDAYSGDRYTIRRYRKMGGEYKQQSKFNISSSAQAKKLIDALQTWISQDEEND